MKKHNTYCYVDFCWSYTTEVFEDVNRRSFFERRVSLSFFRLVVLPFWWYLSKIIVILIDGGYFDMVNNYLLKKKNKNISFERLTEKLCEGNEHIRTKYYHANPYQSSNPTEGKRLCMFTMAVSRAAGWYNATFILL